ncbi:MAG TPA: DUF2934 domain-containing protein [Candidatus Acidoferrum sp.]|nr:DUF2934 domain-containing protein [Candidatus Acidoferrum sp.]
MTKIMESVATAAPKPRVPSNQPTQEEIALRAYHIYLERGGAPGNEMEDWIQAERQLLSAVGKSKRKAAAKSNGA